MTIIHSRPAGRARASEGRPLQRPHIRDALTCKGSRTPGEGSPWVSSANLGLRYRRSFIERATPDQAVAGSLRDLATLSTEVTRNGREASPGKGRLWPKRHENAPEAGAFRGGVRT